MTLTDLCAKTRNWFDDKPKHFGKFNLTDTTTMDFLHEGQFYRIIGDVTNDSLKLSYNSVVYCDTIDGELRLCELSTPESVEKLNGELDGAIWELSIPKDFVMLWIEIYNYEQKNADILNSPFQSESFGGYSYSKANGSNGALTVWDNFASDIARWQKI